MGQNKTILLIDDDRDIHIICKKYVEGAGYFFQSAFTGREGLEKITNGNVDLVLLDYRMPDMNGIEIFKEFKTNSMYEKYSNLPFIMLTVIPEDSVSPEELLSMGFCLFLKKPFGYPELINVIENIFINNEIHKKYIRQVQEDKRIVKRLKLENDQLRSQIQETYNFENIIGSTPTMLEIFDKIMKIAKTDANVFIYGESGTGKELIARSIHVYSRRKDHAFIAVDCMALPLYLLENELFGIEEDADAGSDTSKKGSFLLADKGTLFFDEICELNADLQAKLLRVIQEKQFLSKKTNRPIAVDFRIISASVHDPESAVSENRLREDLYYRLNVIPIKLPPLRERKADIPLLVNHFLKKLNHPEDRNQIKFSPEAMRLLKGYHWPGNVRELQNVVERVISLASNNNIHAEDLPEHILHNSEIHSFLPTPDMPLKDARKKWMEKFERNYLIELLSRCNGNISEVARVAQSNRMTVYRMIKNYNISTKKFSKK